MRELLEDADLAQPDRVEHDLEHDEVVFFWDEEKLAVIIERRGPGDELATLLKPPV